MPYLGSIDQLRTIEWGRSYLWDIRFPDAPAPFSDWFPAVEVEEPSLVMETEQVPIPYSSDIPTNYVVEKLTVVVVDDIYITIHDFLRDWFNKGVMGNDGILPLRRLVKPIEIISYDNAKNPIKMSRYLVYPNIVPPLPRNSDPGLLFYSVQFSVLGYKDVPISDRKVAQAEENKEGSNDQNTGQRATV